MEWDQVCYLDPYSQASEWLPRYLFEVDFAEFKYITKDTFLLEHEIGFAFINLEAKTVPLKVFSNSKIYLITGRLCLNKDSAVFLVKDVSASNYLYAQLELRTEK